MKREGFWRDVTPPLNIYGVPLPFTMIYLLLFPYPSKTTFWVCSGICCFCAPGVLRMDCRTLCRRLYGLVQGKQASGRPWWYRHRTELPREWRGTE